MGNSKSGEKKEFEVKISHPRFTKSKIVTSKEERYLETSFAIDEKEFDKWNLLVNKYGSQRNNLMLPAKTSFNRTAMCGHTGNATVLLSLARCNTRTTPTSSLRKSMTAGARNLSLLKWRFGTCCIAWSELGTKPSKSAKV